MQESDSEADGRDNDIDDVMRGTPEVNIHKHERAMK